MNELTKTNSVNLDSNKLSTQGDLVVNNVVASLGIPRELLPPDDDIRMALFNLPRELNLLPTRLRNKFVAKAVVASSVGLFDGAIIYVWNCVVTELRNRVNSFGMEMIARISNSKHPDGFLDKIQDVDLLDLCYQLNIITEEGHFYLQQCREIRNHASIAHPSNINIDDRELINFISRCCKYGLSEPEIVTGIDIKSLNTLLEGELDLEVFSNFVEMLRSTFKSQQVLIFKILYSNFVDSTQPSLTRSNALKIAEMSSDIIKNNQEIVVELLENHNKYLISRDKSDKRVNSVKFFEGIGQMNSLSDNEKISSFTKAINNLRVAHYGMNNYYNEPPFAERLYEVSRQINPIPEQVIDKFVSVNLDSFAGNAYGVSWDAARYCEKMLKNLTPKGIENLISRLSSITSSLSVNQKSRIKEILEFYETSQIPNSTQKVQIISLKSKFS